MTSDQSAPDDEPSASSDSDNGGGRVASPNVTVVFKEPYCRPGSPEAHRHGCRCGFETNLRASLVAAERNPDTVLVVIHKDCPLHEIIQGPVEPELDPGGQSNIPPG